MTTERRRTRWSIELGLAALAFMALLGGGARVFAQGGMRVDSFSSQIRIEADGSLAIEERIDYDFDGESHHGIFRDLTDRLAYDRRSDRLYRIDVSSVAYGSGTAVPYTIHRNGNTLQIQIGDPKHLVTGRHTYVIRYRVQGALNGFSDHDELFWNVTGNGWQVPIDRVSVQVVAPGAISGKACFSGPYGSTLPCDRARRRGDAATFRQAGLGPGQGVTVVVGFRRGLVPTPQPILTERWAIQRAFALTPATVGLSAVLFVLLVGGVGWLLWTNGRDRHAIGSDVDVAFAPAGPEQRVPLFEHIASPVQFAPPDDVRPGQVGTLVDEMANPLDVTATIVDLAVRGYLRIEEIPKEGWFGHKDWRLVKLRDPDGHLLGYEQLLLAELFEDAHEGEAESQGGPAVTLSSLRRRFATRLKKVEDALYEDAVRRGWFAARPDQVRERWHRRGWLALIAGGVIMYVLARYTHFGLVAVPVALAGLLVAGASRWMPRRTPKGTGLVRRIVGFRTYIATAEAQEARFQEQENIFSRYLPYAIVFGLTEKWARAFAELDRQGQNMGWYVGTGPFTVAAFTSSIGNFTVSTAGTIASTPGGSGASGFGGGGFSGGGGGGGGGGAW